MPSGAAGGGAADGAGFGARAPPARPPLPPTSQPTPRAFLRRLSLTAAATEGNGGIVARFRAAVDARRHDVAAVLAAALAAAPRGACLAPHILRDALAAATGAGPHADGGSLEELLAVCQEAVACRPCVALALRPAVGRWVHVRVCLATLRVDELTVSDYCGMKEKAVGGDRHAPPSLFGPLELDFAPFARGVPALTRPQSIGSGALFLNRHLAATLATGGGGAAPLVAHLAALTLDGTPVMLNQRAVGSPEALSRALARASAWLAALPAEAPTAPLHARLESMGFLPGWGATAGRAVDTMNLLADVLEAADPDRLASFLARVPSITRVALVSPHGWFAQAGVLGRADTGGQVVYVLDQVKALERAMTARLAAAGVAVQPRVVILTRLIPDATGTTCDVPVERVAGTEAAVILRVPFRKADGAVLRSFVPRFAVWPYLERFAADAAAALEAELGGVPQLCVGNYSDGNLVAALLSARFDCTQIAIAHALEMTKYPGMSSRWDSAGAPGGGRGGARARVDRRVLPLDRRVVPPPSPPPPPPTQSLRACTPTCRSRPTF